MASTYFSLISNELDNLESYASEHDEDVAAKLQLNNFDIQILEMFCSWLESWDYNDEQSDEYSRFIITHLKLIWVQQNNNFNSVDDFETWPKDIQDFDPLIFGLKGKIEQSKPQIEKWCQILLRSYSTEMHCKSSIDHITMYYNVYNRLHSLVFHRDAKFVPFKNQIDILKDMLGFTSNSWFRVGDCIDSNELLEYRNFVHVFSYKAACLICLYWAKEANEDEIAAEMNIALFDMLHNIKPSAAHVTASYFAVLKSNNLMKEEEDLGQTHASFVDFFFEYTILKDDFLILRERLIVLFTFLTGAPHENAEEEEEDLIRSQIYALFHEDAYLLLPISEMKKDVSNKNMLLSDFMIKIDILIAKFIQLYCRPTDSWNRLEAEKMNNIYFASLRRELSSFKQQDQVHLYLKEIRFLRTLFFQCFETWDDSDEETRVQLCSVVTSLQRIWGQEYDIGLLLVHLYAIRKGAIADWDLLDIELKRKFLMSKQEINTRLVSLSHCSFHCRPSTSKKILKFMDSIFYNISDLISYGACKDAAFKKQTEILQEKLLLLKNFLILATNCADSENLEEFNMLVQVFASNAACLIYLYWTVGKCFELPAEANLILSNMLQKIKPNTPEVARMYIGTLKAISLQPYDYLLLEQTTMSFVDYFFEDLVTTWKDDFQILRDEVMFYLTFVHHHYHTHNAGEIFCSQLDVLFNDGVFGLLPFDVMKEDFSKKTVSLIDSMMNIRTKNAKIRQLYCKFPDSFVYTFPRIIGQGFIECLIQKLSNLKERMVSDQKYVPFAKYEITRIEEELVSLNLIFDQILEVTYPNDTWLEIVSVVYLAEHVISLCFIFYHLIYNYISYLSDVVDKIKAIRAKLGKNEEYNIVTHPIGFTSTLLERDPTSEILGVVVGFEEDEKIIIDNITRGTESLDIVSIVGMGGLGKTTLAKKIYASVKSHFNIFAFAYVSQDHDKRRLLIDILRNIVGIDAETSGMTNDDLAHKLKKRLSRQKYLIVLDDIWNINAWYEIRSSFPDDLNGSRVMFTTRSLEVARRCQIKCYPHSLRFLTEDESWKLLQMKVFHNDMPPPNISSVAKLIAKKCNGLPLSIVVIAGLLARTETSMWIEISKRVGVYLSAEGCMDILELSYKYLPKYLKPCLLYLGAFPADSSYRVNEVTLLWIDEGFINESKTKSLNDVAKEYLYELVDRSFVIVDEMITGDIRTFRVHDLIHDFCQKNCQDDNFFQLGHGNAPSCFSSPSIYNHYRVSVQKLCDITNAAELSLANTRSILYFHPMLDFTERHSDTLFCLRKLRFAQVLYLKDIVLQKFDFAHVSSFIDMRHIEVRVQEVQSIPSSISNLWNMQSLILKGMFLDEIYLPETLWRMKSLRHVKVNDCKFEVSDGYELNAYPQLDKVVNFSRPYLSTGKDVEWLLHRLPVVRKLSCILVCKSLDSVEERVETFDFHKRELETLKLYDLGKELETLKIHNGGENCPYIINFPSTLIKLTLSMLQLSSTAISSIAELQYLRILKLRDVSFPGPTWEMEGVTFPNLKYFELLRSNLVLWNASIDSFPCLEHVFFDRTKLEELPSCFVEISSLKKITVKDCEAELESSALQVQEEQMDLGNKLELVVSNVD